MQAYQHSGFLVDGGGCVEAHGRAGLEAVILGLIGVDSEPQHIAPARCPAPWDDCGAQMDDGAHIEPDWDQAAQWAPDFDVDERANWRLSETASQIRRGVALRRPRRRQRDSPSRAADSADKPTEERAAARVFTRIDG